MKSYWKILTGGFAIREVAPNSVDLFGGASRIFELREPGGALKALGFAGGALICSCGAWDCPHLLLVNAYLAKHAAPETETPRPAA